MGNVSCETQRPTAGTTPRVSVEDDARFEREYKESNNAVAAVAEHLEESGNQVRIIAEPDFVPRDKYLDRCGDILSRRSGSTTEFKPVEVKGRLLTFTCREDFPYPTIIVDRVKESGLAALYVSVNKAMTVAAFVRASTKEHWLKRDIADTRRGYPPIPMFLCPIQYAEFVSLKRRRVVP
jgi:hypothetical protein